MDDVGHWLGYAAGLLGLVSVAIKIWWDARRRSLVNAASSHREGENVFLAAQYQEFITEMRSEVKSLRTRIEQLRTLSFEQGEKLAAVTLERDQLAMECEQLRYHQGKQGD